MSTPDQNSGRPYRATSNPGGRSANAETLRRIAEFVYADFEGSSKDAYTNILFNLLSNAPNNQRVPWPFKWDIGAVNPVHDILGTKEAWPKGGSRQKSTLLRLQNNERALREHLRVAAVQYAEDCKEFADRLQAEAMVAATIAREATEAEEVRRGASKFVNRGESKRL